MRWWVEITVVGKAGKRQGENSGKIVKGKPSRRTVENRVDGERGRGKFIGNDNCRVRKM